MWLIPPHPVSLGVGLDARSAGGSGAEAGVSLREALPSELVHEFLIAAVKMTQT